MTPTVLYAYVCCHKDTPESKPCGLVYRTVEHKRTYETEETWISHGLCDEHFDLAMEADDAD